MPYRESAAQTADARGATRRASASAANMHTTSTD
jgi:hypothetical protein